MTHQNRLMFVKQLPEVGNVTITQAESLQERLDDARYQLALINVEIDDFINALGEDWTQKEIDEAILRHARFGFPK